MPDMDSDLGSAVRQCHECQCLHPLTYKWFLTLCVLFAGSKLEGDLCVWIHVPHLSGHFVSGLPLSSYGPGTRENISQCLVTI